MRLRLTPRAVQDLADIATYVRDRNPLAALRIRAAILDSLTLLTLFPEIGRRQRIEGVRKLTTRKYPYFVYYSVDRTADEIVVITIRHPARDRENEDA